MIRVGIVGVSGYAGGELARLLMQHPLARPTFVISNTYKGQPLPAAFPSMAGRTDLVCHGVNDLDRAVELCDMVFLAQENGFAMAHVEKLLDAGKKVVDLSADFRLKDTSLYPSFYKFEHAAPALLKEAVYGLPELFREKIPNARLIANPGCYATGSALAMAPLVAGDLIDPETIVINAMSGVSGYGRSKHSLAYHFPELNENASAYATAGSHRHTPEIEQTLSAVAGSPISLSFTPHLIPVTRGILVTAIARLRADATVPELLDRYKAFYGDDPAGFVIVLGPGELPGTKQTAASNYVYIGLNVDHRLRRVTVVASLDNLVKGAAGQAIQNMNLIMGLPETSGLTMAGLWP